MKLMDMDRTHRDCLYLDFVWQRIAMSWLQKIRFTVGWIAHPAVGSLLYIRCICLQGTTPHQSHDLSITQESPLEASSVRQEDDRTPSFLGNLFRRYVWLAVVYVALSGLDFSIVGGIARFMFGQYFQISMDAFGSFGSGFTIEGGNNLPPEVNEQIKNGPGCISDSGKRPGRPTSGRSSSALPH